MCDTVVARSNGAVRTWTWPSTIESYRADISAMLTASVAEEGILGYDAPLAPEQEWAFCDTLDYKVATGGGHVLVGADEQGVIGMCVVDVSSLPNCRHIAEVSKTYLDPRVRRTTAVTEVAWMVCRRLRQLEVETLKIDVREDSPAHHVWRRFGFVTYGILDDYSRVNGNVYRGHFMTHSIGRLEEFARLRLEHAKVEFDTEVADVAGA